MKNRQFAPARYAVLVFDATGERITGTASMRDQDGTRALASNILQLMPRASYCELHVYEDAAHYAPEALETVTREERQDA